MREHASQALIVKTDDLIAGEEYETGFWGPGNLENRDTRQFEGSLSNEIYRLRDTHLCLDRFEYTVNPCVTDNGICPFFFASCGAGEDQTRQNERDMDLHVRLLLAIFQALLLPLYHI